MSMRGERLRVFTGTAHPRLANDICSFMGVPLGAASLARFPDGEMQRTTISYLPYQSEEVVVFKVKL